MGILWKKKETDLNALKTQKDNDIRDSNLYHGNAENKIKKDYEQMKAHEPNKKKKEEYEKEKNKKVKEEDARHKAEIQEINKAYNQGKEQINKDYKEDRKAMEQYHNDRIDIIELECEKDKKLVNEQRQYELGNNRLEYDECRKTKSRSVCKEPRDKKYDEINKEKDDEIKALNTQMKADKKAENERYETEKLG